MTARGDGWIKIEFDARGTYTTACGNGWPKDGFVTTSARALENGGMILILEPAKSSTDGEKANNDRS